MNRIKIGRGILFTIALFTTFGGFVIDVNYTHLFNPKWTPHARYHDALTITLALCAGLTGLYFLNRRLGEAKLNLILGTALPAFLPLSQVLSFLFPTVGGLESEFPELVPKIGGFYFNELPASLLLLGLSAFGYFLARKESVENREKF
jgi:uncharacterized protein YneF (UPF0154 family)